MSDETKKPEVDGATSRSLQKEGEEAVSKTAEAEVAAEAKPAEDLDLEAKLAAATLSEEDEAEKQRVDAKALKAEKAAKKAAAQVKAGVKKKGKKKGQKAGPEPFIKRTSAPRMQTKYLEEVQPALIKQFGYTTSMDAPRLVKIVLNMGLGEALTNAKLLDAAEEELNAITGQKCVITQARKSIATYKLRQGQKIGAMVTLRRARMYEFFDRLVSFALPRTRDFKGISPRSFDGRGNFSMGVREQIIFPEIDYDKIEKIMGLNVTIVTSARNDEEGRELLRKMGMPFRV